MHTHTNIFSHQSPRILPVRTLRLIKKAHSVFRNTVKLAYFHDENRGITDQPIGTWPPLVVPAVPIHRVDEAVARRTVDMQMHMFMLKTSQTFKGPVLAS
jgi:hypothetical protein